MKFSRRSVLAAGSGLALTACNQTSVAENPAASPRPVLGQVRRISSEMDTIIPADAVVEELGSGYQWAEGPLWVKEGNYLLFTDVPGNVMYKWTEASGVEEFLRPSGFAGPDASHLREGGLNGLAMDASGALVVADTGNRNISRMDLTTKAKTIIVELFEGKRFNSPNDVVVHSSGALYFTDPPYGLAGMNDSPVKEQAKNRVYRLDASGALAVIDDTLTFPNGIAFSPDEQTLYVSQSDGEAPLLKAYALGANGLPTSSRILFDAKPLQAEDAPGNPDGMAIDQAGRIFTTGPGGVLVLSPTGELLGVIGAGRPIANCKFGEDGSTLFVTAQDKLGRIRTSTKGVGF